MSVVFVPVCAVIAIITLILGGLIGRYAATKSLHKEAVQRGFATWVSDENGNTTFTWKEPAP